MDPLTPAYTSSLPAVKKTRHEIATQTALSLRYIDELTHNGTLPHFKIGKSIRYDPAEVEAALRERFHVRSKVRKATSTFTRAPSPAA